MHTSAIWTPSSADIAGATVVVTGATSGLGLETAGVFAGQGGHVILTARSAAKGEAAARQVLETDRSRSVEVLPLDLTSLDSIREFGDELIGRGRPIDVLVNNAGVMATPLERTADGFELQIGTNHLGHVALAARLLPLLSLADRGRVVTVSSVGHRWGTVDLDDLNWERRRYRRWPAYFQSKLANLLFAYELDRRLRAAESTVSSLAAHPGATRSHLGAGSAGMQGALQTGFFALVRPMLMATSQGALPQIRAALDHGLDGGTYVGPNGPGEYRGRPVVVDSSDASKDRAIAAGLWDLSNRLTGAEWPV
jgi:NAD(P)-dependent dehydrogenase (short-subunit alcohol dehydrogenase family)